MRWCQKGYHSTNLLKEIDYLKKTREKKELNID